MTRRPKRKRLYVSYEMLAGIPACPRGLRHFWEVFGMGVFFVWCKETQLLLMEIFDSEDVYWLMAHLGLYDFIQGVFMEQSLDEIPF